MGGEPKQLLMSNGRMLLQHAVDAAGTSDVSEVVVVLGRAASAVRQRLALPHNGRVVVNEVFAQGQASSLKRGLEACSSNVGAAVVMLGDQPELDGSLIDRVAATWRAEGAPIVRCAYEDGPGHPVLLARAVWGELDSDGDEGAKPLMTRRPDWVHEIDVDGPRPRDVDTRDDLRALERAESGICRGSSRERARPPEASRHDHPARAHLQDPEQEDRRVVGEQRVREPHDPVRHRQ
jgi:molybdenum cofactor cytidylyltransferase